MRQAIPVRVLRSCDEGISACIRLARFWLQQPEGRVLNQKEESFKHLARLEEDAPTGKPMRAFGGWLEPDSDDPLQNGDDDGMAHGFS